jgi:quercetin dioxygenase-like cupin family protein
MKPEASVLNGKVLKRSLPVLQLPLEPDAPALKRLLLPQGELAQFYDAEEGIRYMAFMELLPDQVRGNHYHKVKEELVYVIRGEVLLSVEDIDSKARASVALQAGDLGVIRTEIAHAYRTVKAGQAIEFSSARFNPADIHRHPLAGGCPIIRLTGEGYDSHRI